MGQHHCLKTRAIHFQLVCIALPQLPNRPSIKQQPSMQQNAILQLHLRFQQQRQAMASKACAVVVKLSSFACRATLSAVGECHCGLGLACCAHLALPAGTSLLHCLQAWCIEHAPAPAAQHQGSRLVCNGHYSDLCGLHSPYAGILRCSCNSCSPGCHAPRSSHREGRYDPFHCPQSL